MNRESEMIMTGGNYEEIFYNSIRINTGNGFGRMRKEQWKQR